MSTPRSPAPIISVLLLLLPMLYVGSYLALVVRQPVIAFSPTSPKVTFADNYRCCSDYAKVFYWPLEQLDRSLQPRAWNGVEVGEWIDVGGPGHISGFSSEGGLIIDDQDASENLAP
jgi:hypothetical protein